MDFSELSNLALIYAAVGAREYSARLTVLHGEAFELPRYFSGRETDRLVKELAAAKKAVRTDLAEHVKRILGSSARGLAIEYAVLETHPIEAVLSTAESESISSVPPNNVFRQNHRSGNTACNHSGVGRTPVSIGFKK